MESVSKVGTCPSFKMGSMFPESNNADMSMNQSRILIADDEKFNCDIIEGFLMVLGVPNYLGRTDQCSNGEQAVKRIQQSISDNDLQRYGLILMDCHMPFMDGYEATRQIRNLW